MPDKLAAWLTRAGDYLWLFEIGGTALLMIVALAAYGWASRRLLARAKQTANLWDNAILAVLRAPVWLLIFGGGLTLAAGAVLPAEWDGALSLAKSLVWAGAFFWLLLRATNEAEKILLRREAPPLHAPLTGEPLDRTTIGALLRTARFAIALIATLTLMHLLGVSITGILAFGGIGGIVVGFAVKDLLSNLFSGLLLFWDRPFAVGDWIRCPASDIEGVVEHIGWRVTRLRTFDNRPLYVPNAIFAGQVIENPQRMTNRRIYEYFGLRYADLPRLPKILEDVRAMLDQHEEIAKDRILMVNFDRYGDSSVNFFIYAMTRTTEWGKFHRIKENVLFRVADIVAAHEAEFAFPSRTIYRGDDGAAAADDPDAASAGGRNLTTDDKRAKIRL